MQNCTDSNDKIQYFGLLVASPYGCVPRQPTLKATLLVMGHSDGSHTRPKLFQALPVPPLPPHLTSSQGHKDTRKASLSYFWGRNPSEKLRATDVPTSPCFPTSVRDAPVGPSYQAGTGSGTE